MTARPGELDRAALKRKLKLIKGGLMGQVRTKATFEKTKEIVIPPVKARGETEKTIFVIKRASNSEDVERANLFSTWRTIYQEDGMITERDYPPGDIQMETIRLCLVDWNLEDEKNNKIPINAQTILKFIWPEERVKLYEEILDFNPTWRGGKEEEKND